MQLERREDQASPDNCGTEFTLRWHNHDGKLADTMTHAWEKKLFLDVTLGSGNRTIGAHRLVLCACSAVLETLLTSPSYPAHAHPNPMLYFNDIDFDDLVALVEFMYRGSMIVTHQTLPGIINAAQILKIRGLYREIDEPVDSPPESNGSSEREPLVAEPTERDEPKRKRPKKEKPVEVKEEGSDHDTSPVGMDSNLSLEEQKKQQLAAFLSVLAQTPLNASTKQHKSSPAGPSPALRSRLVWDPAHIVYLESWYGRETRYPNLVQCQSYANQLSQVPQTDQTGKSRTSMSVTPQNVSHWFQNRRRKDTHPEIEEKRVKRGQTRRRNKTCPLDLTQPQRQQTATTPQDDRDSDDEPGLCIAEQAHSDTENDPIHHPLHHQPY